MHKQGEKKRRKKIVHVVTVKRSSVNFLVEAARNLLRFEWCSRNTVFKAKQHILPYRQENIKNQQRKGCDNREMLALRGNSRREGQQLPEETDELSDTDNR